MSQSEPESENEIIIYQPDETLKLDVRVEADTVWLTQAQMAELFQATKQNVSLHISNIFKEGELEASSTVKEYLTVQNEGKRKVKRVISYYNLDIIISVGYRVKSLRGTQFRQWANKILKSYLLRGYSINQRLIEISDRLDRRLLDQDGKIAQIRKDVDFFVRTAIPPHEGILFEGQIFDAYYITSQLIRKAAKRIVLIDNYIDETVFIQLDKRNPGVTAIIYTHTISRQLRLDQQRHNSQYEPIDIQTYRRAHDRFLIIDEEIYHLGASLKDLGKKLFAFSLVDGITGTELLSRL
ncbi:MAG: virulence RhuM family protein [Muribaculaceae bacterium]|nr:virulence RhuM family protein [Muribaculaceae bacterium]